MSKQIYAVYKQRNVKSNGLVDFELDYIDTTATALQIVERMQVSNWTERYCTIGKRDDFDSDAVYVVLPTQVTVTKKTTIFPEFYKFTETRDAYKCWSDIVGKGFIESKLHWSVLVLRIPPNAEPVASLIDGQTLFKMKRNILIPLSILFPLMNNDIFWFVCEKFIQKITSDLYPYSVSSPYGETIVFLRAVLKALYCLTD